jgi:hypothetical protein
MKNKGKKILAAACLGLVGAGCLTGCAMSDEQKAALDLVTEKTDEIITLIEDNMEYNNQKLSKEAAFDMFRQARLRSSYLLDESSILNFNFTATDVLTGEKVLEGSQTYDFSTDVKKLIDVNGAYLKYDLNTENDSYVAQLVEEDIVLTRQNASGHIQYLKTDFFSMIGLTSINIGLEHITNVTYEDDCYKFNVIYSVMRENSENDFDKDTYFCTFVIKDYLFKSVDIQLIRESGDQNDFVKDIDENRIEDMYGSYSFVGDIEMITDFKMTYKYGDEVDLSELNSKITEIDNKIKNGELIINS